MSTRRLPEHARVDASAPADNTDRPLDRLESGALDILELRAFIAPAAAGDAVARLEAASADRRHWWPGPFSTGTLDATVLDLADQDPAAYAEGAGRTRASRAEFFGDDDPIDALCAWLDTRQPDADARAVAEHAPIFADATLRFSAPGGFIPPHIDREQLRRPSSAPILPYVDADTEVIAFVLYLSPPGSGGALRVYDLRWDDLSDADFGPNGRLDVSARLPSAGFVDVVPDAGSLVLFTAGRWVHEVRPVEGEQTRWTLGGFIGRAADGGGWRIWN